MEIFKLFESTIPNVQPGHPSLKDLRRDQLLDRYDEAIQSLKTVIRAKENDIVYRRDLIEMLDKSKAKFDNKLLEANQTYHLAKKHAPESLLKELSQKKSTDLNVSTSSNASSTTSAGPTNALANNPVPTTAGFKQLQNQSSSQLKNSDLDIPLPSETMENRSSLDRRLSEFLKTFPNLTQAGLATPSSSNNNVKPMPGYYTQQPLPPPALGSAPPLMAMMRFPPPPLMPPTNVISQQHAGENHDTADMDLSDYDESSNNGTSGTAANNTEAGIIPMIASAMQQGAGGKQHLQQETQAQQQQYIAGGQQINNSLPFTPRLNPLPFDPSIMEPRMGSSTSSRSDKHMHSDRASHRHSSSSGSSTGARHTPEKNKYSSSSHTSNRSKRR